MCSCTFYADYSYAFGTCAFHHDIQTFDATRFQVTDDQILLLAQKVASQSIGNRGAQLQANEVAINIAVVRPMNMYTYQQHSATPY